jgi:hypothetical protein
MKQCRIIVLLIVMTGACEPPARDPAPAPTPPADTSAAAPDEAAVTTATIIYMEATLAEIEEHRSSYDDEQDYYVMTDDLMWYRAEARAFLETQEFAEFVSRERGPVEFRINGQVRRFEFDDVELLDIIVAYRPGAEPLILAPVDVYEIADYFAPADSVTTAADTAGAVAMSLLRGAGASRCQPQHHHAHCRQDEQLT